VTMLAGMAAVFVIVLLLRRPWKALALLVVCLLPLSLGDFAGYAELRIVEWLPAFLAPVCFVDMLLVPTPVVPRRARWIMIAVLAFGLLACVSMVRFAAVASSYDRAYWSIATGVLLVVEIGWYARWLLARPQYVTRALWMLVWLAVVVCAARVANYYLGTPLPLLVNVFRYGGQSGLGAGAAADRIGGITEATTIGVAALAALAHVGLAKRIAVVLGVYFGAMVVVAGGRTYALTILAVIAVYVAVSSGRRGRAFAGVALVGLLMLFGLQLTKPASQLARLTQLGGHLQILDPYRYSIVTAELHQFALHPLFGKGIGVLPAGRYLDYVAPNLRMGGHSSYASILSNFGLAGGLLLIALLAAPLVVGLMVLKEPPDHDARAKASMAVAMFVIVISVIHVGIYLTGGNGYSDPGLYAVLGLVVALLGTQVRGAGAT
jgi:hypothetical protein